MDNHVTNGSDHGWVLTWMVAEEPTLSEPLRPLAWEALFPEVLEATAEAGHPNGPYVDLRDPIRSQPGFQLAVDQPAATPPTISRSATDLRF